MEYALEGRSSGQRVRGGGVLILVLMEYASTTIDYNGTAVLILVLMEYALEADAPMTVSHIREVLILVLMEYALEVQMVFRSGGITIVLILVLMEYALEAYQQFDDFDEHARLNPCFNGICSRRDGKPMHHHKVTMS